MDIAHRDIKPANIMWGDDGHVRLVDFGLALQGKRSMRTHVGTPYFMPPEIIQSKSYGKSCDIWSLGCVLYMLVTGQLPFMGKSTAEVFPRIMAGTYTPPEGCSPECADLIAAMLTVDVS